MERKGGSTRSFVICSIDVSKEKIVPLKFGIISCGYVITCRFMVEYLDQVNCDVQTNGPTLQSLVLGLICVQVLSHLLVCVLEVHSTKK
ncbi:hypothetical protein BRADI_2g19895v3 [Brachypodium distachyon]|uniref:Uncharacterized protein n=1 Tax=Brachypodium distachyon TaxID=15368 RepID=A0A2K2D9F8_BRADI|nr:hypothetical protein BRADI_2g19895v3 [Brachypodium distachyon]